MRYRSLKKYLLLENIRIDCLANTTLLFKNIKNVSEFKCNLYTFNLVVKSFWEIESCNVLIEKINCKLFIYQDAYFKESHIFNFFC